MADWRTIGWNLRYRWKTVLLWGVGMGGAGVVAAWLLATLAA